MSVSVSELASVFIDSSILCKNIMLLQKFWFFDGCDLYELQPQFFKQHSVAPTTNRCSLHSLRFCSFVEEEEVAPVSSSFSKPKCLREVRMFYNFCNLDISLASYEIFITHVRLRDGDCVVDAFCSWFFPSSYCVVIF